ncbi:hypothetical protein [Paraflavitalea speifideaquila]|uniref:hypothetical protein n=1 Tax=Paraflavitalea speifideaquila TaxID=3076558 RepID=UPI0028E5507E|nr:hypothetical protein [Paraflavitalea speifideiaquila]
MYNPKGIILTYTLIAAILLLASCKKERSPHTEEPAVHPVPREQGVAIGNATTQPIGAAGGQFSTPDGRLTIVVPAGAISVTTDFSIQPITNTLPLSSGVAYRLLPSPTSFQKPVTLLFHYSNADLAGTSAGALYFAFQDPQHVWQVKSRSKLNEDSSTITVETMHFSDWALFEQYQLQTTDEVVGHNEQIHLKVMANELTIKDAAGIIEDILPVGDMTVFNNPSAIADWNVNGGATIVAAGSEATITAPDKTGAMETVVRVPTSAKIIDLDSKREKFRTGIQLHHVGFAVLNKKQFATVISEDGNEAFDNLIIGTNGASTVITVLNSQTSTKLVLAIKTVTPDLNNLYTYTSERAVGIAYLIHDAYGSDYLTCTNPSKKLFPRAE